MAKSPGYVPEWDHITGNFPNPDDLPAAPSPIPSPLISPLAPLSPSLPPAGQEKTSAEADSSLQAMIDAGADEDKVVMAAADIALDPEVRGNLAVGVSAARKAFEKLKYAVPQTDLEEQESEEGSSTDSAEENDEDAEYIPVKKGLDVEYTTNIKIGDKVRIAGLQQQKGDIYNNTVADVIGWDNEKLCWNVLLFTGLKGSVPPKNLKPLDATAQDDSSGTEEE